MEINVPMSFRPIPRGPAFLRGDEAADRPRGTNRAALFHPVGHLQDTGFKQLCLVGFLFSYGFFIPIVHVAFCAQSHGIGPFQAGTLLSVLGLFTTMGNVIWGGFADKYGNMEVFRICHLFQGWLSACGPIVYRTPVS
eukprot:TRINITY_DN8432_c0_g1_i1.p2 TRINITY_DN8432_c0_g1~~TRINITY_DN8432_c0_g1_i1.p2  ORF type:complete len:138 (+),score=17.09 TRINITY_DN8432_c0_g1_i1:520-933(+)